MCAENNKRPKFYKLLDYDGKGTYSLKKDGSTDGYWKLLIDFKMYDNDGIGSPQNAVTPDFSMNEATQILDEYRGGHHNYPVAQEVVDKFVEKYEADDIQYSDRDPDAITDRELLANVLEASAQTDWEKKKLKEYKAKIAEKEALSRELAEIENNLGKMLKAKGKGSRPRDEIRKLQEDKMNITKKLNIYDNQLLRLESTKALADLATREKNVLKAKMNAKQKAAIKSLKDETANKLKEQRKELMKEKREAISELRSEKNKKIEEIRQEYRESKEKMSRQKRETILRGKIRKVVNELNKLLLNPTKEKHVPIGLQKPVAEALHLINMDTVGAEERIAKYDAMIARSTDPEVIAELKRTRDHIESQGDNLAEKLSAMDSEYAKLEKSEEPIIKNSFDPIILGLIQNAAEVVGNTSLRNMNNEQLEAVYRMFKAVLSRIRTANKMFIEGKTVTVADNSKTVQLEVASVGGKNSKELASLSGFKKFGWSLLKPVNAFNVIGSDRLSKLFENVRKGEDTWATDVGEARDYFLAIARRYKYWSWDTKKQYSFKDRNGNEFSLSLPQIMSLYAYSRRNQADLHLAEGGFIFGDNVEVIEKKHGVPLKYKVNDATPYRLDEASLKNVISTLTDSQKFFVEDMQDYLSTAMGEKGNEVSLAMYDIKLFNEKYYFPLKTSQYYREFDPEKGGMPKIKNSSFAKSTIKGATAPIVLEDFTEVWAKHVQDMAMYHSFVLPLEDFTKVYNYHTVQGGYDSVMAKIKNAYGKNAIKYIQDLLDDLNGGARSDPNAGFMNKLISKFKKGAVFASLSVVIQQPSAIGRAYAYINPKYFIGKLDYRSHKKNWEECKKYAPVAIIKEMGYFDTHVGMRTTDWITQREMSDYEGFKGKAEGVWENRDEYLSKLPALADEMTWSASWNAVKRETADTTDLRPGTEVFLKKAGERFTEIITNTQVYDSVLSRPAIMRSKDTGVKMATSFMAEPLTSVNMMVNAHKQSKRGYKKFARGIRASVATSIILNSILVSLIYAARDDDEDETYTEKYLGKLVAELIDGFNPVTYIPIAKDFWSIAQGFDVERSDMSIISDLWEAVEDLFDENKAAYDKVRDTVGTVSNLFGIPVKNIWRDVDSVFNTVNGIINGTPTTGAGIGDAVMEAIKNSIPLLGRFAPKSTTAELLYDAYVNNSADYQQLLEDYSSEESATSALKQQFRAKEKRVAQAVIASLKGDVEKRVEIAQDIVSEGVFDKDFVTSSVNAEETYLTNKVKELAKYEEEGNTKKAEEILEELVERGYDEDFIDWVKENLEDEASGSSSSASSYYKASDLKKLVGKKDSTDTLELIENLLKEKEEYYKSQGENKVNSKNKAKTSVASSLTKYLKPLYLDAWNNRDIAEVRRIKKLMLQSRLYEDVTKTVDGWMVAARKQK
jgi:hypothetical protein